MTVSEAAQLLGVDSATVRRRIERGELRGQQLTPRMWLVSREDVERQRGAGRWPAGPPGKRLIAVVDWFINTHTDDEEDIRSRLQTLTEREFELLDMHAHVELQKREVGMYPPVETLVPGEPLDSATPISVEELEGLSRFFALKDMKFRLIYEERDRRHTTHEG